MKAFRKQVKSVDMIGCEDAKDIAGKLETLAREVCMSCGRKEFVRVVQPLTLTSVEVGNVYGRCKAAKQISATGITINHLLDIGPP